MNFDGFAAIYMGTLVAVFLSIPALDWWLKLVGVL